MKKPSLSYNASQREKYSMRDVKLPMNSRRTKEQDQISEEINPNYENAQKRSIYFGT